MEQDAYTIKTEIFEGPLDLLLRLIEMRKLHINDISLAKITDDYLAHISSIDSFPLKEAAHFILIAATLVLIKSRSLLPSLLLTEEEEGDIKDLERRLREYKRIKELSELVKIQFNKHGMYAPINVRRTEPVFSPTQKTTKEYLFETIQFILRALPKKEMIPQAIIKKMINLEETIAALMERIKETASLRFHDFAKKGAAGRIEIIVSFLAVLELIKRGIIFVKQDKHFADIVIENSKSR
ncbi:MAG: segregation/condensation protein A [bacterium]|nr:segregation/condensation protein A [bacterium]